MEAQCAIARFCFFMGRPLSCRLADKSLGSLEADPKAFDPKRNEGEDLRAGLRIHVIKKQNAACVSFQEPQRKYT